ncbi:poly [ADP-ribose] polymerase tankyrase-1 isoform X2 [Nematostella vectensis]|nr:poly [ADP-ribose] polymerase tankyrase-1 isoform X2 [Nematostella vectensis]
MMLAITAPYMVISAWTENISMVGAAIVFTLWPILVYYPLSHWIRGGGWLNAMRVIDYSGSLTVHASLGASALVFTRILRPCVPEINSTRASFQRMNALSHVMLVGGAFISIMGWYAVNVASTIIQTGSSLASISVVNTHLSSSTSLLCWLVVSTLESRGLLYSDVIAGLIAGVIGSSAAAASMQVWASLLSGLLAGVTSSLALCCARRWGPYWTNGSPVDFIYINGVPGLFAALSAGLLVDPSLDARGLSGAFYAGGRQLGVQLLGVVVTIAWSAVWTYLLSWFIHISVGFNLSFSLSSGVTKKAHSPSYKLPDHVVTREKLFVAASEGDLKELENMAAKQVVNFGTQDFDKRTALLLASSHGHVQCVKFLLRQPGVDIHSRDRWRATPLTEAIKYLHDRVVQCLIKHGASWSDDGAGDILCTAVARCDMEEVSRLITLGMDVNATNEDGSTALHVAATRGARGIVQYLIDHRADINAVDSWGNTPLNYSDMHEHRAVSQLLEGLGARRSSRHYSTQEICEVSSAGNLQMLRHMVHNGACVSYRDANRRTPLHVSSAEGHLDIVKFLLLQPGIDVNARDKSGKTPLLDAIVNNRHEVVEYLKSHGAVVDETKLVTIATEHARNGDAKSLKRMLRLSGHLNASDFDGMTLLHVAAAHGRMRVVSMLLKEGADVSLVNRLNQTPQQLASLNGHTEVERELRRFTKKADGVLHVNDKKDPSTMCYKNHLRIRKRRHKTEPSAYHYARRGSWSDHTDQSVDFKKHEQSSVSTENLSRDVMPLGGVQSENKVSHPPFLRVTPISHLSPTTREMAGGEPDYV